MQSRSIQTLFPIKSGASAICDNSTIGLNSGMKNLKGFINKKIGRAHV